MKLKTKNIVTTLLLLLILFFIIITLPQKKYILCDDECKFNIETSGYYSFITKHQDLDRKYDIYIPKNFEESKQYPLVFVFHGGGGKPENAKRMTGMSQLADKENFIVVYPSGTTNRTMSFLTWNAGDCCGFATLSNIDDIGFIKKIINNTKNNLNIDSNKIFATGFSNGAMMSYKIACELPDIFKAVGTVSGTLAYEECNPKESINIIHFHGDADYYASYDGGIGEKQISNPREDKSVVDTIKFWANINECIDYKTNKFGNIIHDVYTCNNSKIELYTIKQGGHAWPGGNPGIRYGNIDEPNQEIIATELIWEFFKK
ncbi:MAG: alpha/beta hydrolase family esterase [Candidatus Woesearchaeota archaeon]